MDDPATRRRRRQRWWGAGLGALVALAALALGTIVPNLFARTALDLRVDPPDAEIQVDGDRRYAPGTGDILLGPGHHELVVSRPGYVTAARLVVAPTGGDRVALRLTLAVSPGNGIEVSSEPAGAAIYLDGRWVAAHTNTRLSAIAPGRHSVEVRSRWGSWRGEVIVLPERTSVVHARLPLPPADEKLFAKTNRALAH